MKAFKVFVLIAIVAVLGTPAGAVANSFACCLPSGACEILLPETCETNDGILLQGATCAEGTCSVMAPVVSLPAILILATALLTLAIYALIRRSSRE